MYAQICVIYEYTHTTDGDSEYSASYEYTQKGVGLIFEWTNNNKKIDKISIIYSKLFLLKLFIFLSTFPFVFNIHIVIIDNENSLNIQQYPKRRTQKLYYSLYQYKRFFIIDQQIARHFVDNSECHHPSMQLK